MFGSVLLFSGTAQAQIVPDQTLGSERSSLTQNVQIRGGVGNRIDGGAIRGSNLFHSFSDFNVSDGGGVYFSNPIGIQNILTRVTGSNRSSINGTLGVDGTANLFLLNPNGIVFGQNAQLDLRGSFTATTANAIGFGTQGVFSATTPTAPALLTINPAALLFNQLRGSEIVNQGGLVVPSGQSLLLVGGNVKLDGGFLGASNGRVELGGISAPGSVGLTQINGILSSIFPDSVERSNVSIVNGGTVLTVANDGGSIAIHAKDFVMDDASQLTTGILRQKSAIDHDITIDATDSVTLNQGSFISSLVNIRGIADGGNIVIKTGTLSVNDGSAINTNHLGQGNGGNISITARDSVTLSGANDISSSSVSTLAFLGQGNGGNIQITTGSLSLAGGASVTTSSSRPGNSGSITVNARNAVTLDGSTGVSIDQFDLTSPTKISAELGIGGVGSGGNIAINTGTFTATNGGSLSSATFGQGNAGNIRINARDSVVVSGSVKNLIGISSSEVNSSVYSNGNGGNIEIATGALAVTGGGSIAADTLGQGNAGNILITARDGVKVDGESQDTETLKGETFNVSSTISSDVVGDLLGAGLAGVGKGGEIRINTGALSVTNSGNISSNTSGQGNAGNITIGARDRILVDGSGKLSGESAISSRVTGGVLADGTRYQAIGQGGTLNLSANQITLSNGGYISTATSGNGNAGNILIFAPDSITISGVSPINSAHNSKISARANSSNPVQGGAVQVQTGALSILNGAELSSSNLGNGDAGSIRVRANSIALKDNSSIATLTTSGNGGNLFLTARDYLLMRRGSSISASATATPDQQNSGNSGNITINAAEIVAPLGENNTIAANATKGNGGNLVISTQGLYGIQPQLQPIPGIGSITASSELGVQGQVTVTQPEFQPTQGTVQLPTTPIPDNQIAQVCPRGTSTQRLGSFVVSGRGSAPPNPIDAISGNTPTSTLATVEPSASTVVAPPKQSPDIIEAQGWVKSANGIVQLVTNPPSSTSSTVPTASACPPAKHS